MISIQQKPVYIHKYIDEDLNPVKINSVQCISDDEKDLLISKYRNAGFVVFELQNDEPTQNTFLHLVDKLGLGKPYVPPIYEYTKTTYEKSKLNIIKASGGTHRAFQTNNEQNIHSDGTVEKIGKIKTSILICQNQATKGGETIIFNSVAAFYSLFNDDDRRSALIPLLDKNALRRVAINSGRKEYIGPAFEIVNGEIISRFSLDNTCDWEFGFNKVSMLKEAFTLLKETIRPSSPFYIQTTLKMGQGIIMANDKVSHGRKHYRLEKEPRIMIRGLFEKSL